MSLISHLQQLTSLSEWDQAFITIKKLEEETRSSYECILKTSVDKEQWQIVEVLTRVCTSEQRNFIAEHSLAHSQVHCLVQAVRLGVEREIRGALLERAVTMNHKEAATLALRLGVSQETRERVCKDLVALDWWDFLQELIGLGVSSEARSYVFSKAVTKRQAHCSLAALKLGLCHSDMEDALRQAVERGDCRFLLHLVHSSNDLYLKDFVLSQALIQNRWWLVEELLQLGLDKSQKERVCDEAVLKKQWDVAFQLLQNGITASQSTINGLLCHGAVYKLKDFFLKVPNALKEHLLMGAICEGDGLTALYALQNGTFSDDQVMKSMVYSINILDKQVLLLLLRGLQRCRRIFRDKFRKQTWKRTFQPGYENIDGGEVRWIFETFCEENEINLALEVAIAEVELGIGTYLLEFFENKPEAASLKQKKMKVAVDKLFENDLQSFIAVKELICERSVGEARLLFFQALRFGSFSIAAEIALFCSLRNDLKFACRWFVAYEVDPDVILSLFRSVQFTDKEYWIHYSAGYALKQYFERESKWSLDIFLALFKKCFSHSYLGMVCFRGLFKSFVTKAVRHKAVNLFAEICTEYFGFFRADRNPKHKEELLFAFNLALGSRLGPEMLKTASEKMFKNIYEDKRLTITYLVELVLERRSFHCLAGLDGAVRQNGIKGKVAVIQLCLRKMLLKQVPWIPGAKALLGWIKMFHFSVFQEVVYSFREVIFVEQLHSSAQSLAAWCLEKFEPELALMLAFSLGEWCLVNFIAEQRSLDQAWFVLPYWAQLATKHEAYSSAVALLKRCCLTSRNLGLIQVFYERERVRKLERLVRACGEAGLEDWALGLSTFDMASIGNKVRFCHNQAVLDHIFRSAFVDKHWDLLMELLPRCKDQYLLVSALKRAVEFGNVEVTKMLLGRVDISANAKRNKNSCHKTLLFTAVQQLKNRRDMSTLHVLIASGLSTFQRTVCNVGHHIGSNHNSPLLMALDQENLPVVSLMLRSGTALNKSLFEIKQQSVLRVGLEFDETGVSKTLKEGYRMIIKAASNPGSLEHLARLAVSHLLSYKPGRSDRIDALPVPRVIKDLICFKDVMDDD